MPVDTDGECSAGLGLQPDDPAQSVQDEDRGKSWPRLCLAEGSQQELEHMGKCISKGNSALCPESSLTQIVPRGPKEE